MGYDRIISWVESHFNPRDYPSYFAFEQAIRERFNQDGIDLPKGAESQMMDYFEGNFPQGESPVLATTLDDFAPVKSEIMEIDTSFFAEQPESDFWNTSQPFPEMFKETKKGTIFGRIGGSISSMFKKLFRF